MKYVCDVCGYIYDEDLGDPDNGIAAGTKFDKLPEYRVCPLCRVGTFLLYKTPIPPDISGSRKP